MWKSLSRNVGNRVYASLASKSKNGEICTVNQLRESLLQATKFNGGATVNSLKEGSSLRHFSSTLYNKCSNGALKAPGIFSSNLNRSIIKDLPFQQRCFQTSSRRNALPPFVVVVLGRLAKIGAVIFGRTVRRWWRKLSAEERAAYSKKAGRNRYIIAGILGATAFGSFVYYDSHIQETPFTNRKRFLVFTTSQIIELAKMELDVLLQANEPRIIPAKLGNAVYRRIVKVAQQLLQGNQDLPQIHELEWTVTVVDDDSQINAFVLPCGSIFVYSGLLKLCDSDDQLGIILGHEMAHAVMDHGAEKASFMHFLDWLFVIPLAAVWALLPSDLTAVIGHGIATSLSDIFMELPHSRFIEEEADQVGLVLAAKACFDIREAPVVWAKMKIIGKDDNSIEWLSTHPSNDRRQAQLEEMLPDALIVREKCQCPRLPVLDPRLKIQVYKTMQKPKSSTQIRKENLLVPLKVDGNTTREL